jgi:hypothetical protein
MEDVTVGTREDGIGLLQVRRGSVAYQFSCPRPDPALAHLRETGQILERPESIGENEYILGPVEELSAVAKSLQCSIVLKEPGKDGPILAQIGGGSYSAVSDKLILSGETAITGKVERVGGATELKCGLRVPSQNRMLFCRVASAEVARKLGQKLYEEVAVYGTAYWLKTSWRIVGFNIQDVRQPRLGSAAETIEALRNAGGKGWDRVEDPEAFIEEVSGER